MGSIEELSGERIDMANVLVAPGDEAMACLGDWNATYHAVPDATLVDLLNARAAATPEAVAVMFETSSLTYAQLHAHADRLARVLVSEGIGPEDVVAIALPRSIELVVALVSVLKAGAAYLPLDSDYPPERLSFMLRDARPARLITHTSLADRFTTDVPRLLLDDQILNDAHHEDAPLLAGEGSRRATLYSAHPAYVIYTSGSTGLPKGVVNTHAGLVNRLKWMQAAYPLDASDVVLQKTPCSFDVSVWEFFWPLVEGATLLLARPEGHKDPVYLTQVIQAHGVTTLHFVPSMLQIFLDTHGASRCSSLRRVICSGEALSKVLQETFHRTLTCSLHNLYGPTEAAIDVTAWTCHAHDTGTSVPIGNPIWNTQVYILDDDLCPLPADVTGQLYLAGQGLARGYLRRPAMTAERFTANPFDGYGTLMYRTGDLARRRTDGVLEYLGRVDHQVKLRGYRIELGEIEACLLGCEGVREAVATLVADPSGDHRLVGYVTPSTRTASPLLRMLEMASSDPIEAGQTCTLPNGLTIFHQNPVETRFIYDEIFSQQVYLKNGIHLRDGDCVFDVGANIGLFSLFVAQRWPNATIHAFEPLPPVFDSLRRNASIYGLNGMVHAYGLSDQAGEAVFQFCPNDTIISSSRTTEQEARNLAKSYLRQQHEHDDAEQDEAGLDRLLDTRLNFESHTCRLRRLSQVIAEHGIERIDLLKIDVENAELEVLRGIDDADWARIEQVVVEVHDVGGRLADMAQLFRSHGFLVQVEQEYPLHAVAIHNLYARRPTRVAADGTHVLTRTDWGWSDSESLIRELRTRLALRLPEYMVPGVFVVLDAFPMMPNGKLDRSALPHIDWDAVSTRVYEAPLGQHEMAIAGLWRDMLGLDRVGRHDNFFELGGHSLTASRVLARIQREHGVTLPLKSLFSHPVLKDFAEAVQAASVLSAPPIPAIVRLGARQAPLSYSQEMLFLEDQLNPSLLCYNVAESFRITGELDMRALEWALTEIARRQESLRTRFVRQGEDIVQLVDPAAWMLPLPIFDLTGCGCPLERESRARQLQMHLARSVFSLDTGPIMRAMVIQCDDDDYRLVLVIHHIATDGWGQAVLRREIGALYRSFGGAPSLPPLPVQYLDYAAWQRHTMTPDVLAEGLGYWKRKLEGATADVTFPVDRPRPPARSFRGARERLEFAPDLSARLKRFCGRNGTTPFILLLAVLKALLHRFTAENDVVIGTVFSDRSQVETESLVGNMTNTVALRSDLSGHPSFRTLLDRVGSTTVEAHRYRHVPFQMLVEHAGTERVFDQNPFFQVTFVMENVPNDSLDLGIDLNVAPEMLDIGTCIDHFGLTLAEEGDHFAGHVEYSVDLYDAATIRTFMDSYLVLLRDAMACPDRPIDELGLLSATQYEQLLDWGKGARAAPCVPLVVGCFERQVHARGEALALVCDGATVTYRELNDRANQLAWHLISLGVGPEVAVGVLLERTPELYVAMLAIMKAGGIYVPLDPAYPLDRLHQMATSASVRALLTGPGTLEFAPRGTWTTIDVQTRDKVLSAYDTDNPSLSLSPDNLAYIMYTSGSTGRPKAVGISHRALANQIGWAVQAFALTPADRFLHKASVCFDSSIEEILCPLICGAVVVAARPRGEYEVEYLAELMQREEVTCIDLAPSLLSALMDVSSQQTWRSVRLVISGGEVLKPELAAAFKARYPCTLCNTYGPTEATVQSAFSMDWDGLPHVAIGRPVAHTELYVLDRSMQPVPPGVAGELYIGGVGVARGYLNQPAVTAAMFVPHPFGPIGDRLYRTGDRVRWKGDGQLEFLGRMDHQVKLRGYRIELSEIERAIETISRIGQAVVMLREDPPVQPYLAAYVVADAPIDVRELRDALRSRLPRYMVPTHWTQLASLPLNANGKIDRKLLPEPDTNTVPSDRSGPRNDLEAAICGVFENLLQQECVGIHDNFFDMGGHSLSATRAMSRLSTMLGKTLPVRLLFEAPTAAHLAKATGLPATHVVEPGQATDTAPDTERLLASLETLSEEEIGLLLQQLDQEGRDDD